MGGRGGERIKKMYENRISQKDLGPRKSPDRVKIDNRAKSVIVIRLFPAGGVTINIVE